MGFILRRCLPAAGGLAALLLVITVGGLAVGLPLWWIAAFVFGFVLLQFVVSPWIIQWLVPASIVARTADGYAIDHPLGAIVARRCRDAGIPLVKLGIVEDGEPNAFTFGRRPGDARIWVTRGLIERLDQRELDAVVAHEVGHIKHWDFVVMTVAAVVPMILYLVWSQLFGQSNELKVVALGAFVAWWLSEISMLALSRARETAADHWSCKSTGDGDALASALVRIAYGIGEVRTASKQHVEALEASGDAGKAQVKVLRKRERRSHAVFGLGILSPKDANAYAAAFAQGIDPDHAIGAMRWELTKPWARFREAFSTHPLVVNRIKALEESGLPGAPRQWSVLRATAAPTDAQVAAARAEFLWQAPLSMGPWVVILALGYLVLGDWISLSSPLVAAGLLVGGIGLFAKQMVRYPGTFEPVPKVAGLLERHEAGPLRGVGVVLQGVIMGKGMPGYVLSPDLVLQDDSGFVTLLYEQPVPFSRTWFALARTKRFLGQPVVARGWYRRMPYPVVELREVRAANGQGARCWMVAARFCGSVLVFAAGLAMLVLNVPG